MVFRGWKSKNQHEPTAIQSDIGKALTSIKKVDFEGL